MGPSLETLSEYCETCGLRHLRLAPSAAKCARPSLPAAQPSDYVIPAQARVSSSAFSSGLLGKGVASSLSIRWRSMSITSMRQPL